MKIWIDADAAPNDVKKIVFRASARLELETALVANQPMSTPTSNPRVRSVVVPGGPDVADQHIIDHAEEGDLAITADIPLAAALVEKGVLVLDPRGERYSEANVRERLSIRDFMESLRNSGVETGGPKAYGQQDRQSFANALDRLLTEHVK
ncbi:MAG TPA: YaiI/YqxD family protein [Longimicrobiales bacterium]|nr:YaiI/YqxD family protein [Longimicrobiales bacterium]